MDSSEPPKNAPIAWSGLALERLAQMCAKHSEEVAVRAGDRLLSYSELAARSDAAGTHLASIGVTVGDLVGVCMDRTLELVPTLIGIWKAGAAFVPLDPAYPKSRLAQMLSDAAPRVIVCDRSNRGRLRGARAELVEIDSGLLRAAERVVTLPAVADVPAYVIFTSGSSGRPKGVQVGHRALANFLAGIQQSLEMQPADTLVAITTLSFDISVLELVLPLMQGATVIVADAKLSGGGSQLGAALETSDATYLQATPITWRLLLDSGWEGKRDLTVICGGENFPRALAEDLLVRSRRVFNVYGPTEATIWATLEPVESGSGPVPIGRALPNYQTHVLDEDLNSVVPGEIGELYLGGASLANGYIKRPAETARRFVPHPTAGRLYRTGDLVRQTAGDALVFVERADTQVKIHGFRVELREIELRLAELPGVKEALVVLREDTLGDKKLAAYLIPDGTLDLAAAQLRGALKERLPDFMVPHHYVQLTRYPRTPNNKVDLKRLPTPEASRAAFGRPIHDPLQTYLHSVWSTVLGTDGIGPDDNFFDLGGDSIQAARITNRVQEWLGELLWPVVLFDAPTIAEFDDYLRSNYPDAIAAKTAGPDREGARSTDRVVDDALVARFEALLPSMGEPTPPTGKNPPAVFVLCPPRSGSTLLRVMLAGHPRIFAPPELELLTFDRMDERSRVFSGRESYRLEGTLRAVMEIKGCSVEDAREVLGRYERGRVSVAEFYGTLQGWLSGRLLVDKTPANCLDLAALHRIEAYFQDPVYIHLTRHPLGMIRSFVEARLSEVFFRRVPHRFSPRELAELIWLTCHRNALALLASVPAERQFRLAFETLTHRPRQSMEEVCRLLGIDFDPEMLAPHHDKENKMTDGLHAESKMMGDPKFHQHDGIDPRVADRWKEQMQDAVLGVPARALAQELGYADLGADEAGEREEFIL